MINNTMISIIIPVFNAEKYLEQCVESVLSQDYNDWELLLIDDGSTDSSSHICDKFAKNDHRIKVLHQKNVGVAESRNNAIALSKGHYIAFVDADDILLSNHFLSRLLEPLLSGRASQSICGAVQFNDGESTPLLQKAFPGIQIINSHDYFAGKLFIKGYLVGPLWCILFQRKDFEGLKFPAGRLATDNALLHHLLYPSQRIAVVGERMYGRRRVSSSLSSPLNCVKLYEDAFYAFTDRIVFFIRHNEPELAAHAKKELYRALGIYYRQAEDLGIADQIPPHLKPRH